MIDFVPSRCVKQHQRYEQKCTGHFCKEMQFFSEIRCPFSFKISESFQSIFLKLALFEKQMLETLMCKNQLYPTNSRRDNEFLPPPETAESGR